MTKKDRNEILRAYYNSKDSYDKLAQEIVRLFDGDIDPSVPVQSIYTIKHRIKGETRFLEKVEQKARKQSVTVQNFRLKIEDILGLRIVCLRLSDVEKIERYLSFLQKEGKLVFVRPPAKKQTFVLPVNPGDGVPSDLDLQYSGYSSIHYVVRLGKVLRPPKDLGSLRCEIQVRTILEEAWGEIDHKYRYEIVRRDSESSLPGYITRGFYNFSAYLQAAALQAEYLCRDVEAILAPKKKPAKRRRKATTDVLSEAADAQLDEAPTAGPADSFSCDPHPSTVEGVMNVRLGFQPVERLAAYVKSRLKNHNVDYAVRADVLRDEVLSDHVLATFRTMYKKYAGTTPFEDAGTRDIDAITAVNFGLAIKTNSLAMAQQVLGSILRKRFGTVS